MISQAHRQRGQTFTRMLYDLNVPWTADSSVELQRIIAFLDELGYNVLALNHNITGAIPAKIVCPIPTELPFKTPTKTTILRRCTVYLSDPSQNHRLPAIASAYDILALRPTNEKTFLAACVSLSEQSIISLDLASRFQFHFRPKPFMTAINRGIKFEICYGQPLGNKDNHARRNFISNVMAVVRATKGRGLVISSEAKTVLGVRAPADVENLMVVWGLNRDRGSKAMCVAPRSVVVNEGMKRRSFRGVVDVVDGGQSIVENVNDPAMGKEESREQNNGKGAPTTNGLVQDKGKRKTEDQNTNDNPESTPTMSKRKAKKMRLEALKARKEITLPAK